MDVSYLVHSVLIVRDDILEVLQQASDPVVVGELVKQVGHVERGGLHEEQVGDPLVVGMIHRLHLGTT